MSSQPKDSKEPIEPEIVASAPKFAENPPLAPSMEDQLREWWFRNSRSVYAVIIVVFVAIIAKGSWEIWQDQQEKKVGRAYNAAATNDQLKSFIAANPDHVLAGVAALRLGDDAYSNSKYNDAVAHYDRAAATIKDGPFGGRARLGAALSRLLAGQQADGESRLKAILNDTAQLKGIRAEAAYHLGSAALEAGRKDEANTFLDQASAIDPGSAWAQRALMRKGV
ncbi:tetratricopeptide repeat protein [Nibricoccus sp. IMCC34717]|uniref:tetratricopeptide repeat protein n=1 Tax=Nibricoccus sp. IMCC34717 TaxID=3034021 RepID=UPI00384CD3E5